MVAETLTTIAIVLLVIATFKQIVEDMKIRKLETK